MQDKFLGFIISYCLKAKKTFMASIDLFCKRLLYAFSERTAKVLKIHLFFYYCILSISTMGVFKIWSKTTAAAPITMGSLAREESIKATFS